MVQIAERGKLDAVFYGDSPSLSAIVGYRPVEQLDPVALHGALSAVTSHIGLAATLSTTFNELYSVARKLASLNLLSQGRAGWNVVTTSDEDAARNFGLDGFISHERRYQRADEFVQVVKLWRGWDDDAITYNVKDGIYADTSRIRAIDHDGPQFKVRGPLTFPVSARQPIADPGRLVDNRCAVRRTACLSCIHSVADALGRQAILRRTQTTSGVRP